MSSHLRSSNSKFVVPSKETVAKEKERERELKRTKTSNLSSPHSSLSPLSPPNSSNSNKSSGGGGGGGSSSSIRNSDGSSGNSAKGSQTFDIGSIEEDERLEEDNIEFDDDDDNLKPPVHKQDIRNNNNNSHNSSRASSSNNQQKNNNGKHNQSDSNSDDMRDLDINHQEEEEEEEDDQEIEDSDNEEDIKRKRQKELEEERERGLRAQRQREREKEEEEEKKKKMYINQKKKEQQKQQHPKEQDEEMDDLDELDDLDDELLKVTTDKKKRKTIIEEEEEEEEIEKDNEEDNDVHQQKADKHPAQQPHKKSSKPWKLDQKRQEKIPIYQTQEQHQSQFQYSQAAPMPSQPNIPSFESSDEHQNLRLVPLDPDQFHLPNSSLFYQLLTALQVQFNPESQRLYIKDQSQFKRKILNALSNEKNRVVFNKEFNIMVNQSDVLVLFNSPIIGESKSCINTSLLKLLLTTPPVQEDIINTLLSANLVSHPPDIIKMTISQLRWLELTDVSGGNCSITTGMIGILDMLCDQVELKKELIGYLPEISEDSGHAIAVDHLLTLMETDSNYTVPVIDALGAFNLTIHTRIKARDAMFSQLSSCAASELPVIINALLQSVEHDEVTTTIKQLRDSISFPQTTRILSSSTGSPAGLYYTSANMYDKRLLEQNSEETFVLDALKTNFRFRKDLCSSFLKEISSPANMQSFKIFDFWLLLVIYSFWNQPKDIETILKKKIIIGALTKSTLLSGLQAHHISLKPYFKILLVLADSFLRSVEPKVRTMGHHFYYILFQVFYDERDSVLSSLLIHTGSGNIGEVDEALSILLDLSNTCGDVLKRHNTFIKRIMDQHEMLLEHQIRKVFRLMASQSFYYKLVGDTYIVQNNKDMNELDMYTRKLSSGSSLKYKKFGIISGCAQIQQLAKMVHVKDKQQEKTIDITAEVLQDIMNLFNSLLENCKKSHPNDKLLLAYLYDEMEHIFTNEFSPKFIKVISDQIVKDDFFTNLFNNHIGRLDGVWFKKDDSTMGVDIYPKLCNPSEKDDLLISAPLFRFLQTYAHSANNTLDELSSVLDVPLVMFDESQLIDFEVTKNKEKYALAIYYAVNWIRETINAFSPQMNLYHNGVSQKLNDLIVAEERLDLVLSHIPSFIVPYGSFNSDQRKNLSIDLKKIKKKKLTWLTDEECDHYLPFLEAINQYQRKLDLNALSILQYHIKNSDGNSTLIDLNSQQLHYLLTDLNTKMTSLLSSEKPNPFGHSTSQRHILNYTFNEMVKTLMGVFPSLCIYLERIQKQVKKLYPQQEEMFQEFKVVLQNVKDDPENKEYQLEKERIEPIFTENKKIYALNLANIHLIFDTFTKLFSYDFDSKDFYELMSSIHETRTKSNPNNPLSTADLRLRLFNYYEGFWDTLLKVKAFRPCISLLTLMTTLYSDPNANIGVSDNRRAQGINPKEQIFNYAQQAIGQDWGRKINATSTSFLLKTLFKYSENPLEVGIIVCSEFLLAMEIENKKNQKKSSKGKRKGKGKGGKKGKGKSSSESEVESEQEQEIGDDELGEATMKMISNHFNIDAERIPLRIINSTNSVVFYRTIFNLIVEQMSSIDPKGNARDSMVKIKYLVQVYELLIRFKNPQLLVEALKNGKNFIIEFTKHFIPITDKLFEVNISDTRELIKEFQKPTRQIQHICTHGKNQKEQAIVVLVPSVKKAIASFNNEIKIKFAKHKWGEGLTTKILKAKTVINDKRPSSSEEESEEEDDDEEEENENSENESNSEDESRSRSNDEEDDDDNEDNDNEDEAEEVSGNEESGSSEEEPSGDDLDDFIDDEEFDE